MTHNHILTKQSVGKIVYLLPNGNSISRYKGSGGAFDQVKHAVVSSVARVNVQLIIDGANSPSKYRKSGGQKNYLDNGYNGGYFVFLSKEAVNNHYLNERLSSTLRDNFDQLTEDQKLKIAEVIELEIVDVTRPK